MINNISDGDRVNPHPPILPGVMRERGQPNCASL